MNNQDKIIQMADYKKETTDSNDRVFSETTPNFGGEGVKAEFYVNNAAGQEIGYNIDMANYNEQINELAKNIHELKTQNETLKEQGVMTRWVIGFLVTVFGIITPLLIGAFSSSVQAKYDAINTDVNAKFEIINTQMQSINQRLDYQERLNSIQIQRDVAESINKQK